LRKLTPDFKTIADFRKDHPQARKHVCRACTILCKKLDLVGRALIALDGRKCKAVNSQARHVSANKLPQLRQHSNAKSETYLKDLDKQDVVATPIPKDSTQTLKAKIDQ